MSILILISTLGIRIIDPRLITHKHLDGTSHTLLDNDSATKLSRVHDDQLSGTEFALSRLSPVTEGFGQQKYINWATDYYN